MVDVQGRFLDASGLTRQPEYNPIGGEALHRVAARARRQTILAFEPLILLRSPSPILDEIPAPNAIEKIW